jgi:hypothetical protein
VIPVIHHVGGPRSVYSDIIRKGTRRRRYPHCPTWLGRCLLERSSGSGHWQYPPPERCPQG